MISIRRHLIRWMSITVLITSLVIAGVTYLTARHEVEELYDAHLKQISRTLSAELEAFVPEPAFPSLPDQNVTELVGEEDYLIQIWSDQGQLLYSSYPAIHFPFVQSKKVMTTMFEGVPWRSYLSHSNSITAGHGYVQVAQPRITRARMLGEVASALLLPLLLQIPIFGLIFWLLINRSLRPLVAVSDNIRARQPDSQAPLDTRPVPEEIQHMVGALNELLARLGHALDTQRRFIADAAHELRTPLTALQLQLEALRRADSAEERNLTLQRLAGGIERGIRLVQQLLTLTRLEPSRLPVPMQPVALDAIARQVIESHAARSTAKDIELVLAASGPSVVSGMSDNLLTLVNNLVDNAIHYTPAGGRVEVRLETTPQGVRLHVRDNGPGIPAEHQSRVFDRFYRVLGTQTPGTGLGLAIVKTIAEEHGARIELASSAQGTEVSLFFSQS